MRSTRPATCSGTRWSTATAMPSPPAAVTSSAVSSIVSGRSTSERCSRVLRPVAYTVAPASPSATAMPRPPPRVAPLTSATLPFNGLLIVGSCTAEASGAILLSKRDSVALLHDARNVGRVSISSRPVRLIGDHPEQEDAMKYMLLIHQGTTPLPGTEAWESLSQDEQNAVYAAYKAINETPGVTPGPAAAAARDGDDRARAGRQDADHRRPVRRAQGGDRRLPASSRPTTSTPRSSWPRGSRRRAWAARSRCARSWSGSDPRAGLPRPVGTRPRCPDRLPRRLRPRRGGRAGGVRDRRGALAARRRPRQPGRLAGDDGAQPRDRPHPPRSHAGREDAAARGARGSGGQRWTRRRFPTSGSSSSSPAAIRRSPPTRRSRSRCARSAA